MTTKEIQQLVAKSQVNKGHSPVIENLTFNIYGFPEFEMDIMSMTNAGMMYEYEVKVSRADYRKDSVKKKKHNYLSLGHGSMPNYFYYVCQAGLIMRDELPCYAGLMYVHEGQLRLVKLAPRLHDHKHDLLKVLTKVSRVFSERMHLGACKLTVKNRAIKATRESRLKDAGFTGDLLKEALKKII